MLSRVAKRAIAAVGLGVGEAQTKPETGPAAGIARIRPLSPLVASQIAAGEVVERPASVVKELLENALDSGATRIVMEIEQGGIELIRVTDDGCGIVTEDLPLAFAAHATSKVRESAELERIGTLGFRGEAVASIASVSRMLIRTRRGEDVAAHELSCEGDVLGTVKPAAGTLGTSVTVRTLFYNTPARRKFLRTIPTEQGRCLEAFENAAMAHPAIGFKAVVDGKIVYDLARGQGPRDRMLEVLGKELADELLDVHADEHDDVRGVTLWGVVGKPSIARATNKAQHVFVNGRPVRDRTIMHAIAEGFRGLIEIGKYPTAVIMIDMNPALVDVNVHPQKAEVRFRDSSLVHSAVLHSVRRSLREADLTPLLQLGRPVYGDETRAISPGPGGTIEWAPPTPQVRQEATKQFVEFFQRTLPARPQNNFSYETLRNTLEAAKAPEPPSLVEVPRPEKQILQVHKTFLVAQDDQGVLIVDQHALHERVMFEFLLERMTSGMLESQRLLIPAVVSTTSSRVELLPQLKELLAKMGIEAEAMGPTSVGVHAFATFLFDAGVDPGEFVAELLERAENDETFKGLQMASEEAMRDIVNMMACKAAVKAGDRLSQGELAELMDLRGAVDRASNCPHGRPTTVRLTIKDLEKLFGRI